MTILLSITCSFPTPAILYLVFMSSLIGFPASVTLWESCSISENALASPYHCASYFLRPEAVVIGSSKAALSSQSVSLRLVGFPRKSFELRQLECPVTGE